MASGKAASFEHGNLGSKTKGSTLSDSTPLRLLYLEDDPALRGILAAILRARRDIEIVAAVGTAAEAIAIAETSTIDVALLDLSLIDSDMTGIEVGIALRQIHPHVGVVLLSQHRVPFFLTRIDPGQRTGWSYVLKKADLQPQYLIDVIFATRRGLNVTDPAMMGDPTESSPIEQLSSRQREVMALAAEGLDAPTIASALNVSAASVRQDLSRAYSVLVPDPVAGADLRTLAVLKYLHEMRSFTGDQK